MTTLDLAPVTTFPAPDHLTAPSPAEQRGLRRDDVRLLVADSAGVRHAHFRDLADFLTPGDLVVVNTSQTVAAEVDARMHGTTDRDVDIVVHVAADLGDGTWVIELRKSPDAARAELGARAGQVVRIAGGRAELTLLSPWPRPGSSPTGDGNRLWRASYVGDAPLRTVMDRLGRPIAYGYLDRRYPLEDYQTIFGTVPGSAEMPGAARPFTAEVVTRLVARGVVVAPIVLHTGVSSQEAGEAPQPEWFDVSDPTARLVNSTRAAGGRVVAVGTTVTRALESAVADHRGDAFVQERAGWTERVISRDEPARVVDGLVTGWHDPAASHLLLIEAVAGAALTQRAYDSAVRHGYRWHEFGDAALLLP